MLFEDLKKRDPEAIIVIHRDGHWVRFNQTGEHHLNDDCGGDVTTKEFPQRCLKCGHVFSAD